MRFTTKTEYGLVCLVFMARHQAGDPDKLTTIKEIVRAEQFSETYIAKILNTLKKKGIITSHKGMQGGYALSRKPSEITLKEIVQALEGKTFEAFCDPKLRSEIVCTHLSLCGIKFIWNRTKEILDNYYESVTLETMIEQSETDASALHEKGIES